MSPPPPRLADVARTLRVAATGLAPSLVRLAMDPLAPAPSSATADGLAKVARRFHAMLGDLGIRLEVERADRVPRDGGLVLMWNQESHLDHLVLPPAIPRPFFSLFNNAVARVPFYGAHLRASGHVHVDRHDEAQWRPAVAGAAERVARGECVLVSPEGTRSADGRLLPMKRGAFLLAVASTRPVVCVTVIGGHGLMPRGSAVARAGTIRVAFSDPIPSDKNEDALAARVASTFETTKRERALLA
jgi:1-acyl-sn-glycerol-3-phosphate acyltransferase